MYVGADALGAPVIRARIAVIARQRCPGTGTGIAAIVGRAGRSVVAQPARQRCVPASTNRIARVLGTNVPVVARQLHALAQTLDAGLRIGADAAVVARRAIQRRMDASDHRIATVLRARIQIFADHGLSNALALDALLVDDASGVVVARPLQIRVLTTSGRHANVQGAGTPVVAVHVRPGSANAGHAGVVAGTGIAVLARRRVNRHGLDATPFNACRLFARTQAADPTCALAGTQASGSIGRGDIRDIEDIGQILNLHVTRITNVNDIEHIGPTPTWVVTIIC
jgi:hypothetical protein